MRIVSAVTALAVAALAGGFAPEWAPLPAEKEPAPRLGATATWTGRALVVWGGYTDRGPLEPVDAYLDSGARYDPVDARWSALASKNAPSPRAWHTAVWTGREVIIWGGGANQEEFGDGVAYDPAKNLWRPIAAKGAPSARLEHSAVWTGTEMIVWSGVTEERSFTGGGRYDPATDTWRAMARADLPFGRRAHGVAWTGTEMIVWGGINGGRVLGDGLRYDPAKDRWRPMSDEGAPSARGYPGVAWTGKHLVVWGGQTGLDDGPAAAAGARYDPAADRWTPLPIESAPASRSHAALAWTGEDLLVWGGSTGVRRGRRHVLGDGAAWNAKSNAWRPLPSEDAPAARSGALSAWTGDGWIVWGGAVQAPLGGGAVLRLR